MLLFYVFSWHGNTSFTGENLHLYEETSTLIVHNIFKPCALRFAMTGSNYISEALLNLFFSCGTLFPCISFHYVITRIILSNKFVYRLSSSINIFRNYINLNNLYNAGNYNWLLSTIDCFEIRLLVILTPVTYQIQTTAVNISKCYQSCTFQYLLIHELMHNLCIYKCII